MTSEEHIKRAEEYIRRAERSTEWSRSQSEASIASAHAAIALVKQRQEEVEATEGGMQSLLGSMFRGSE